MRIISVDDEVMVVEYMEKLLKQVEPEAEFAGFSEPEDAFDYLSKNKVDIALLDIELGEYSGIELAKRCKDLCPFVNIIFVTGYSKYMLDAFQLHASGYLMKPVRASDLHVEIENLRHPILSTPDKRIRIQAFGHFEVFADGFPLKFPRAKCKECLAYLVDRRGARITYSQLSAILWEDKLFDRTVQNNTQKIVSDMMKTLKEADAGDIIVKSRLDIAIVPDRVDCDYFEAMSGNMRQMNKFTGEYMTNYSWAEFTLGDLAKTGIR